MDSKDWDYTASWSTFIINKSGDYRFQYSFKCEGYLDFTVDVYFTVNETGELVLSKVASFEEFASRYGYKDEQEAVDKDVSSSDAYMTVSQTDQARPGDYKEGQDAYRYLFSGGTTGNDKNWGHQNLTTAYAEMKSFATSEFTGASGRIYKLFKGMGAFKKGTYIDFYFYTMDWGMYCEDVNVTITAEPNTGIEHSTYWAYRDQGAHSAEFQSVTRVMINANGTYTLTLNYKLDDDVDFTISYIFEVNNTGGFTKVMSLEAEKDAAEDLLTDGDVLVKVLTTQNRSSNENDF